MRYRNLFPGALLLAASACAQTATQAPTPDAKTTTLNVTSRLVVVPVIIRDSKEHLIRNLSKDDFTLTVDGKPQAIRYFDRDDDVPLTVGLLVDVSGSMRNYLEAERTASSAFLDGMLQPGRDAAFVVQFGRNADLLADVTGSIPKLQAGLQKLDGDEGSRPSLGNGGSNNGNGNGSNDPNDPNNSGNNNGNNRRGGRNQGSGNSGGGTVLYDATFLSSDEVLKKAPTTKLAASAAPAQPQARKAVVLLTDGEDRGSTESLTASIEAAQRNDVAIYAIYYKGEEGHTNNGNPGGGRHGGMGIPGMGGGRGGGFPGGGGGGYPGGGGRGGGNGGNREKVDGKKILERMADETGGRVFEVTKKMTLPDIYKMIAEELRSQYRLGFTPANAEDGYHKIVVDLKDKKLILQARDGYYTGGAASR
jgi:VWFA-related protein